MEGNNKMKESEEKKLVQCLRSTVPLSCNDIPSHDVVVYEERVATAPQGQMDAAEGFRHSRRFLALEAAVIRANQLIHKSFDKLDIDNGEGQVLCQRYLEQVEVLFGVFGAQAASRDYRSAFSQAYTVLYSEGELSYITQILDNAQEGYPCLWVNGLKYPFSPEVLELGSRLVADFYRLEHCLQEQYTAVLHDTVDVMAVEETIRQCLRLFDLSWSGFEQRYVKELMAIEQQARSLVLKAIQSERQLTSLQLMQKMKGKILLGSQEYLCARERLCQILSQLNQAANAVGKGRDDLDHSILCETEGILRRITKEQSKAVRVLGQKIRSAFVEMRKLLRKYDSNIQVIDPQLKQNKQLVEVLAEYERSWEKGANYFCDSQRKRQLLHFSGALQTLFQKSSEFQAMVEWASPQLFVVVPHLLILKSLDKDDRNLCRCFLPTLHQIDSKHFFTYFKLERVFEQWKNKHVMHYNYYNILQKSLLGTALSPTEEEIALSDKSTVTRLIKDIQLLGMQLHSNASEWNSFMEVAMYGLLDH